MDWIAEARIDLEMVRLLTLKTAWMMDTVGNKAAAVEISAIKVAAPNVALRVIDRAIQVHGAGGLSDDFPLAQMYAHQRTLRLADGPDEVHKMTIARRELRRHDPDFRMDARRSRSLSCAVAFGSAVSAREAHERARSACAGQCGADRRVEREGLVEPGAGEQRHDAGLGAHEIEIPAGTAKGRPRADDHADRYRCHAAQAIEVEEHSAASVPVDEAADPFEQNGERRQIGLSEQGEDRRAVMTSSVADRSMGPHDATGAADLVRADRVAGRASRRRRCGRRASPGGPNRRRRSGGECRWPRWRSGRRSRQVRRGHGAHGSARMTAVAWTVTSPSSRPTSGTSVGDRYRTVAADLCAGGDLDREARRTECRRLARAAATPSPAVAPVAAEARAASRAAWMTAT